MDMRKVIAAGLAAVTVTMSAGCARADTGTVLASPPPNPASLPSASTSAPVDPLARTEITTRVALLVDGIAKPFRNGQKIVVGSDLVAEVWFTPYPPLGATTLTVQVLDAITKEPVANADVFLLYDMPEMGHGTIRQRVAARGAGTYQTPLNLYMLGTYQIAVEIRTASGSGSATLELTMALPE
ncbi:MAG: FixH family protein [Chloroflexi bacterium]|nr:FixH family protein [Chloroflexota bacterium]